MGLSRNTGTLVERTVAGSLDETGSTYLVMPQNDDAAQKMAMSVVFNFTITGGTTPTLDAYVDSSVDGTSWVTVATMTQLTSGSRNERVSIAWCGPLVRARVDAGGGVAPQWTGKVSVTADMPFSLLSTS